MTRQDESDPRYLRFIELRKIADQAFNDGELDQATELARELLALADDYRDDWNYGNAIHHGHRLLGHVALEHGDMDTAKAELLASGDTRGSPQLNSFGPNMSLAKSLLEKGETECVITYLERCGAFWQLKKLAEKRPALKPMAETLDRWIEQVMNGEIPEFGPNLLY